MATDLAAVSAGLLRRHTRCGPGVVPDPRLGLRDSLYCAVWQTFDPIAAGTWVLTTGILLLGDWALLGRLLVALGFGLWLFACATMLGVHSLAVLAPIFGTAVLAGLGWSAPAGGFPRKERRRTA